MQANRKRQQWVIGLGNMGAQTLVALQRREPAPKDIIRSMTAIDIEQDNIQGVPGLHPSQCLSLPKVRELGFHRPELRSLVATDVPEDLFVRFPSRAQTRVHLYWNFKQLSQPLVAKVQEIIHEFRSEKNIDEMLELIFVSSLAGNTGSALLLDMAYLIQAAIGNERPVRIVAYVGLPPQPAAEDRGVGNAYATLCELDYRMQQKQYSAMYRLGNLQVQKPPFDLIYLEQNDTASFQNHVEATAEKIVFRQRFPVEEDHLLPRYLQPVVSEKRSTRYAVYKVERFALPWEKFIEVLATQVAFTIVDKGFFTTLTGGTTVDAEKEKLVSLLQLDEDTRNQIFPAARQQFFEEFADRVDLGAPVHEKIKGMPAYVEQVVRQHRRDVEHVFDKTGANFSRRLAERMELCISEKLLALPDIDKLLAGLKEAFEASKAEAVAQLQAHAGEKISVDKEVEAIYAIPFQTKYKWVPWVGHPEYIHDLLTRTGKKLLTDEKVATDEATILFYDQLLRIIEIEKAHFGVFLSTLSSLKDRFKREGDRLNAELKQNPNFLLKMLAVDGLLRSEFGGDIDERIQTIKAELGQWYGLESYDAIKYAAAIVESLRGDLRTYLDHIIPITELDMAKIKASFQAPAGVSEGQSMLLVGGHKMFLDKVQHQVPNGLAAQFIRHDDNSTIYVVRVQFDFAVHKLTVVEQIKKTLPRLDQRLPFFTNEADRKRMPDLFPDIYDEASLYFAVGVAMGKIEKGDTPAWQFKGAEDVQLGCYRTDAFESFAKQRNFLDLVQTELNSRLDSDEAQTVQSLDEYCKGLEKKLATDDLMPAAVRDQIHKEIIEIKGFIAQRRATVHA